MIISEQVSSPVISNIASTPTRFKIKASAKAFKILSGFYSEPILAIPRELGANAWDSHVKAGNTKTPFLVHAPNNLEPWFSVRDFGTGLSPEHIDHIYTTYFESTKTSDNDSDGCMGLGSKTPFNYADNFNVTSWHNGKKHVYNCFIDETGSPNIMHVVTEDSKDHPGLEVKFGVKIADIAMWVDKITRAYAPFRNRPTIVGANITFQPREYMYEGKTWSYRVNSGWNSQTGTNAFMGNYCYPVSVSALRNAIRSEQDYYTLENILGHGHLDLFFNIGDLEVAPNKEQLQYEDDNATTKNIIAATKVALAELRKMVLDKVEVPKTRWEAMALFQKYNSYNSEYYHLRNYVGDIPIVFNGDKITSSNESVSSVHSKTGVHNGQTQMPHTFQLFLLDTIHGKMKRTSTYHNQNAGRKTLFFYTNGDSVKNARLRHYLLTKFGSSSAMPLCYIITDNSPKASYFHKHAAHFGWDKADIIEIESLPKPPPAARAKRQASTDEIFYFETKNLYRSGDRTKTPNVYWMQRAETVDSTKTYYYVDFLYYDPAMNGGNITSTLMADIFKVALNAKILTGSDTVYGINKKNQRLLKTGKWINVIDLATKYISKHKADFENERYLENFGDTLRAFDSSVRHAVINNGSFVTGLKNADTKAIFSDYAAAYKKYVQNEEHTYSEDFYNKFSVTAKNHGKVPFDTKAFTKLLDEKYFGIFSMLPGYHDSTAKLVKLINFIDEKS